MMLVPVWLLLVLICLSMWSIICTFVLLVPIHETINVELNGTLRVVSKPSYVSLNVHQITDVK